MPQDGSTTGPQKEINDSTHDVEMIDDDISVITPKTRPPGKFCIGIKLNFYNIQVGNHFTNFTLQM